MGHLWWGCEGVPPRVRVLGSASWVAFVCLCFSSWVCPLVRVVVFWVCWAPGCGTLVWARGG